EADRDQQVGAAVIKGAGGTFCSGAERGHLDEVGRDPAEENRYAALGGIYRAFTRVGQLEMPTIAAVRGAAVGAGINLMLATDLGPPRLPWAAALEVERAAQLWSLRRRVSQ